MAKTWLMKQIEEEFDEPIKDVLQGFADMNYSGTQTAKILELSHRTVIDWSKKIGVEFPKTRVANPESSKNQRKRYITYQGTTLTVSGWADQLNISATTLYQRLSRGWDEERTLSTPHLGVGGKRNVNNQTQPKEDHPWKK